TRGTTSRTARLTHTDAYGTQPERNDTTSGGAMPPRGVLKSYHHSTGAQSKSGPRTRAVDKIPAVVAARPRRAAHVGFLIEARGLRAVLRSKPGHALSYFSSTIFTRSTPILVISTSSMSPGFIQSGGLRLWPTPSGVPVAMMSPGCSVVKSEQ